MLKAEWTQNWRNSERRQKYIRLDESTPSKKFLKSVSRPEITDASRLAQFRLGHAPVDQYLKRIGKVDSARCPACGEDEESAEHFFLKCANYAHERWALAQHVRKSRQQMSLHSLLGHPALLPPVAKFIKATNRFRDTSFATSQPRSIHTSPPHPHIHSPLMTSLRAPIPSKCTQYNSSESETHGRFQRMHSIPITSTRSPGALTSRSPDSMQFMS